MMSTAKCTLFLSVGLSAASLASAEVSTNISDVPELTQHIRELDICLDKNIALNKFLEERGETLKLPESKQATIYWYSDHQLNALSTRRALLHTAFNIEDDYSNKSSREANRQIEHFEGLLLERLSSGNAQELEAEIYKAHSCYVRLVPEALAMEEVKSK